MDRLNDPALIAFRDEVRAFLAAHLPDDIRLAAARATSVFIDPDVSLPWQRILHARGWAAPDWHAEFGGPGWNEIERYSFAAESARDGARHLAPMGPQTVARGSAGGRRGGIEWGIAGGFWW